MNLNKKRLQTLTDSSVVDCTACRHSKLSFWGRGHGRGFMGWVGLQILALCFTGSVFAQFQHHSSVLLGRKSLLLDHRNCAKSNPSLKCCIYANTVEATGHLRAHSQPKKKSTSIAPLNEANITNWVLKRQILSTTFPLSHVMMFQTRTQTGHRLQLGAKAGGWRKKRAEQANINSTHLYISICSTNVLFPKENKV